LSRNTALDEASGQTVELCKSIFIITSNASTLHCILTGIHAAFSATELIMEELGLWGWHASNSIAILYFYSIPFRLSVDLGTNAFIEVVKDDRIHIVFW
jgi:hypothetical protein